MATLKAGAAQTNITPPLDTHLAGSLKARHATEVHDELHAKALVFSTTGLRNSPLSSVTSSASPAKYVTLLKH